MYDETTEFLTDRAFRPTSLESQTSTTAPTPLANPTPQPSNSPIPVPIGADPTPKTNGVSSTPTSLDVAPPPSIDGMPPLSATAMSSFASAAKGVTTVQQAGEKGNQEGLMVLNQATAA